MNEYDDNEGDGTEDFDDVALFDDEFMEYARRALEMAGIETDAALKASRPIRHSLLHAISEQRFRYPAARAAVPQSRAHWEQAEFMRIALPCVLWDLQWGAVKSYKQFRFLYSRLLSDQALVYLPQLFAAGAMSPSLDAGLGNHLMRTLPERGEE